MIFEEEKNWKFFMLLLCHMYCNWTPIPKFHFEMLFFNLTQRLKNDYCNPKMGKQNFKNNFGARTGGGGISSLILLKLEGKFKNNNIIIDKQSTLFLLLPLSVKSGVIL